MKTFLLSIAWSLTVAATALGGNLPMNKVAADAQWLVHLDVDSLLKTRLGSFFFQDIINKPFKEHRDNLREKMGVDLDLAKINSLTAFGATLKPGQEPKGVLLLNTELNPSQLLDTLVMAFGGKEGDPNSTLRKVRTTGLPLYVIKDELFLSPMDSRHLLVGKSREELAKAQAVFMGKEPGLKNSVAFSGFPPVPEAFFIVATTGPIPFSKQDTLAKSSEIKKFGFLQMAHGGRVALGESKGMLKASVSLRAADPESSRQMQQVVQGMLALVSLSNSGDPLMRKLFQSARVSEQDKVVTLGLELPTGEVISKLRESDFKIEIEPKDKKDDKQKNQDSGEEPEPVNSPSSESENLNQ